MKNLMARIRAYLLRNLAPKKVIALKLENFVLKNERITVVDLTFSEGYTSLSVHYAGYQNIDHIFYKDRDMALRDFLFISEIFKGQAQQRKAK